VPEEFQDRRRAAQREAIIEQPLPMENVARLVSPIIAKGMARGYFSLVGSKDALGLFDRAAAERSAAACALEMAKAKTVSEAEKRVRGTFVDALLAGSLTPQEAARSARRNGYNPDGRHAAVVVDWAKKEHPTYRRLETLVHGVAKDFVPGVLVQARENEIIVFSRLEPRQGIESARRLASGIRRAAQTEFPSDPLAVGIGRPADALFGLRDSYREARQALSMARRLADPNPLYFGELNVYRLLFQLEYSPELNAFCQEIIGKLVEYDRTQGTNWLETLTAYFAHNGNLTQTAEALFLHRNTLLYRMDRIREISGLDLDNPETRLSVQLALRAYRLLSAREE
jgi:purine catabolism regulator